MAYLNQEQREQLRDELKNSSFNSANGRLKRIDSESRLAYYRNAQRTGQWQTRYVLPSLGVEVTLVEQSQMAETDRANRVKSQYKFVDVVIKPTADNRN